MDLALKQVVFMPKLELGIAVVNWALVNIVLLKNIFFIYFGLILLNLLYLVKKVIE